MRLQMGGGKALRPRWQEHSTPVIMLLLLLAAFLLRVYDITRNPLWLDELYGYQLARLGLRAIIYNSYVDEHPPAYNVLLWLGAGFGRAHGEWGWRWLSVASGSLTIPLLFALARPLAGTVAATLSTCLLLISPAHIYFSQESRPYAFIVLLTVASALTISHLAATPRSTSLWVIYLFVTILGLWSSYNYLLVAAVQLLFLLLWPRTRRPAIIAAILIMLAGLPLIALAIAPLQTVSARYAAGESLSPQRMLQSLLAGDMLRYGEHWPHRWLPPLLLSLALLGTVQSFRHRHYPGLWYHSLQLLLPIAAFWGVAVPLFGIRLPFFEAKQFILLLPSLFVLVAVALQQLQNRLRRPLGLLATLVALSIVIAGSITGLTRYWTTPRSPEGTAALVVRHDLRPSDAVVSLHYALDAASSFYLAGVPVYTRPIKRDTGFAFSDSPLVLPGQPTADLHPITLADIRRHNRIWILAPIGPPTNAITALSEGCTTARREEVWPFQVSLFACP
ncbi:MAG: hypothetical protein NVS4B8_20930 [Herpetosiphon sp.]